jgi:putative Mn2+ efflux pump MntP
MTGLYPTNSFKQIVAIGLGTVIAAVFAIYIGSKQKSFT